MSCFAPVLSKSRTKIRYSNTPTQPSILKTTQHKMHFSTIAAPLLLAAIVSATSAVRRQEQNPCDLATDYPTLSCCNSEASEFLASDCQVGSYSHPYLRSLARSVTQGHKNNRGSLLTAALAQIWEWLTPPLPISQCIVHRLKASRSAVRSRM
jgi:hypothetical protein